VLVLTKPLGTGVLVTAHKAGKIDDAAFEPAIRSMCALNRPGRDAAAAVGIGAGIHAGTDITGYGLVGHAYEMAVGSDVTITFAASAVPMFPATLKLARAGVTTRASKTARDMLGDALAVDPAVEVSLVDILANAETSGGLLLSVAPEQVEALTCELQSRGAICAAVVGHVTAFDGVRIRIGG
jgi:selenide, water dikinase